MYKHFMSYYCLPQGCPWRLQCRSSIMLYFLCVHLLWFLSALFDNFYTHNLPSNGQMAPLFEWKETDRNKLLSSGRPQPQLVSNSLTKKHARNFQKSWYKDNDWLCGSQFHKKLFCWPCLIVGVKKGVWNHTGFDTLPTATRSFQKHEGSSEHIKNYIKFKQLLKNRDRIADAMSENTRLCVSNFNENVRLNRLLMRLPIDAVLFLSRQELPLHGHDDNFNELLNVLVNRSSLEIQQQYSKIKDVFSAECESMQNELMQCISDYIKASVHKEIKESYFYSVQVNDASDITQKSQCSIILRYVTLKGALVKRFLGFYDVNSDCTSQDLFNVLETVLAKYSFKQKLVAQCHEGASVSSHLNDLQAKIKGEAPQAMLVHCLAHHLNVILKESVSKIAACRIFFATVGSIPSFFDKSDKSELSNAIDVLQSSHADLIKFIIDNWDALKALFEIVLNNSNSHESAIRQSKGFLHELNDFEFTLLSMTFYDVFEVTDVLFNELTKKPLDIDHCATKVKETRRSIANGRNEETFERLFNKALKMSHLSRCSQSEEHTFKNYKVLYYEILDTILSEIDTRFQDVEQLKFVCLADSSKFEEFSKKFPAFALDNVKQSYPAIITDTRRLKNELEFIYSDHRYRNASVDKIVEVLNEDDMIDVFKEAYKLFCLILTIPSTSSSADSRLFCLKNLKNYLRNSSTRERLSSLAMIVIEKQLLTDLCNTMPFYDDIIDKYAAMEDRRIELMYKHKDQLKPIQSTCFKEKDSMNLSHNDNNIGEEGAEQLGGVFQKESAVEEFNIKEESLDVVYDMMESDLSNHTNENHIPTALMDVKEEENMVVYGVDEVKHEIITTDML